MKKYSILNFFILVSFLLFALTMTCSASDLEQQLNQTAQTYIKYFKDRAKDQASGFQGLTNSFLIDLGGHSSADKAVIDHAAVSYDQSILARISLAGNITTILDTYVNYATSQKLADPLNPLLNTNGDYYGAGGPNDKILYGPYRIVRISGRQEPGWWTTWDWIVDTGAAACLIIDALEAYQKTSNVNYKNFAILLGGYILKLKDSDGGIRYGPRGMYHVQGPDFYWNLKSTEQNERCLYAFEALYSVTADTQYNTAANNIKEWLKSMYNNQRHLFHSAATFNGSSWVKSDIDGYVATDVMAFAPLEMMFNDAFFGATQQARDAEVDAMFSAIETKTAFLNAQLKPEFFRFSVSQTGNYGSVEWSAQMALAYLRAAQNYATRDWNRTQTYLDKYNVLIASLETFFSSPADDFNSKVAPYASYYLDKSVAGGVPTGTGYYTYNCRAALASCYYAFAKTGYDPTKLGGGPGIPSVLNLTGVPWYQNIPPYNSTGAAVAQMILNYVRTNTGQPQLDQNTIYEYAKLPQPFGSELNPDEMDKVLGHFDPYDTIVSNWADVYDSLLDGNPYQGYNFMPQTYDPNSNPNALNEYMRDICHWMAYTATREEWWLNGPLVEWPNTPAAIPIFGIYNHWVVVKGFATSANPCPEPRTNPWNTPDFAVYGFWIKDPLISGIGQDTYKTAAECQSTYFLPLSTQDNYQGKFVQVAEPPPQKSKASVNIPSPIQHLANLEFVDTKKKQGWYDIVDPNLLFDPQAQAAFNGTQMGQPLLVKRPDIENANYYLVPFNKLDENGKLLTAGVIILDEIGGYFKEASWTSMPEKFLKVNKRDAINLIKKYILHASNKSNYKRLIHYLYKSKAQLLWEPNSGFSLSPYKPYWKIDVNGYIWYVTQEGRVIPETNLDKIIKEIESNEISLKKLPTQRKPQQSRTRSALARSLPAKAGAE